jgi:hypothetical protein
VKNLYFLILYKKPGMIKDHSRLFISLDYRYQNKL